MAEEGSTGLTSGFSFLVKKEPNELYFDKFSTSASCTLQSNILENKEKKNFYLKLEFELCDFYVKPKNRIWLTGLSLSCTVRTLSLYMNILFAYPK